MSRPDPSPVSASSRLKRRALASLCALSFATGTVVVPPITPTANAVAANVHKNQYAETPSNGYAKYTKLDANGRRNNPCNVSTDMVHEYSSNTDVIANTVDGVGRFMAVKTDDGSNFELQVVAQMGNDQGNGDTFPRYREKASFSFNTLNTAPLKPIGTGETVKFESRPADDLIVTDAGDDIDSQKEIPLDGNQNTVMAWRFDNNSPHLTAWALANNITPGSLTLGDVFVSVPMAMSATLAPFPDENAFCQVMDTKSTPVTMLADGEAHPFEIGLKGVKPEDYGRLEVTVVDEKGNEIQGAMVKKVGVVKDQFGNPSKMQTEVTLPKDNPDYHKGKGVFLQVYATPRKGDDTRAAAGPNKGTGLSGNYAYSREDATGKGFYDTNMKIGGLHAVNTPTFSAEHGANSGEPGKTISAQIVGADQPDKGVKAGQEFLGDNNPTFSLGGEVEYGEKNQGDNNWTNPEVDPVTGEATITVSEGAQGGDLAYVPVKVTNSDGSSFIIKATFTSKQPAPVALQPAFKAGPVGDTLKATPRYKRNGEPYIDPTTVRIVGTDENSDGKTLEVAGQGTWTVDEETGEFSFTPVAGFVGDPTPIQYTAKGAKGEEPIQPAEVMFSYYPLETREATTYGPVEATQKSTDNNSPGDAGRTTAQLFPKLPIAWYGEADSPVKFQLVKPDGNAVAPGTALKIVNVGEYTINPVTGVVSFKADPNLLANKTEQDAARVGIRTVGLKNAERDGESAELTAYYRPTVEKQSFALPNARENAPVTGDAWTATPNYRAYNINPATVKMVPVAGNTLSAGGKTMEVPGQGTWTVDNNGVFTFTPLETFVGTPAPVRYEADSNSGQKADGTGQVAIFYPEARTMPSNTIGGQGIEQKSDEVASVTGEEQDFGVTTAEMFPTLPTKWYGQQDSKVTFDLIGPDGKVVESTVTGEDGIARPTVEVPNVGTYSLNPITGLATFDPLPSFTGPAPRVHIQTKGLTGGDQLKAAYTPFVTPLGTEIPSAFVNAEKVGDTVKVTPDYSQGQTEIDKTSIQLRTDNLPEGSTLSDDKKSVTVPGEGTWTVNDEGEFTFTPQAPGKDAEGNPVKGFTGNPTPVSYVAQNVNKVKALVPGQVAAFYPPIDTADAITTGAQGEEQHATDKDDTREDKGLTLEQMFPNLNPEWVKAGIELTAPEGGTLSDNNTKLTVEGEGVYTLNTNTGAVTFTPEKEFTGTGTKVGIKLTGVSGQPTAHYTAVVREATVQLSDGVKSEKVGNNVVVKPNYADNIDPATVRILGKDGEPLETEEGAPLPFKVDGQGEWTVNDKGEFTFTPIDGFLGQPDPIQYTAKDKNGVAAAKPAKVEAVYDAPKTVPAVSAGERDQDQTSKTGKKMFPDFDVENGAWPQGWTAPKYSLRDGDKDVQKLETDAGVYTIDETTGVVTFDPKKDFVGTAPEVTVRATTATGQFAEAPYQPVVNGTFAEFILPSAATQGEPGKPGEVTPKYPENVDKSTVSIVGAGPASPKKLVVPGEGTWTVNGNGTFTFTPEENFKGTPKPIQYTAKDSKDNEAQQPGYVMVNYPAQVDPFVLPSDAANEQPGQSHTFAFPDMVDPKTLKLIGNDGKPTDKVEVPRVGTWEVKNGEIVFTPAKDASNRPFRGITPPIRYTAKNKAGVESAYPGYLMVSYENNDPLLPPAQPSTTSTTPTTSTTTTPATPTSTTTTPDPSTAKGSSGDAKAVVERCFANAVRSPIAWILPIGLLATLGGQLAEPYVVQYQAQLNAMNAEIQARFNEATKDWNRDWGWDHGHSGANRFNERQNEAFAELTARVNAANAQLQQLANDPMIRQVGQVAGVILAVVAASAVLYDWCAPGKGYTAIDFEGTGERGIVNRGKAGQPADPGANGGSSNQ